MVCNRKRALNEHDRLAGADEAEHPAVRKKQKANPKLELTPYSSPTPPLGPPDPSDPDDTGLRYNLKFTSFFDAHSTVATKMDVEVPSRPTTPINTSSGHIVKADDIDPSDITLRSSSSLRPPILDTGLRLSSSRSSRGFSPFRALCSPPSLPDMADLRVSHRVFTPLSNEGTMDFLGLTLANPPQAQSTPISRRELRLSSSNGKQRRRNCYVFADYRDDGLEDDSESEGFDVGDEKMSFAQDEEVDEDEWEAGGDEEIILGETPYSLNVRYTPSKPYSPRAYRPTLSLDDFRTLRFDEDSSEQGFLQKREDRQVHESARLEGPAISTRRSSLGSTSSDAVHPISGSSSVFPCDVRTPPSKDKRRAKASSHEPPGVFAADSDIPHGRFLPKTPPQAPRRPRYITTHHLTSLESPTRPPISRSRTTADQAQANTEISLGEDDADLATERDERSMDPAQEAITTSKRTGRPRPMFSSSRMMDYGELMCQTTSVPEHFKVKKDLNRSSPDSKPRKRSSASTPLEMMRRIKMSSLGHWTSNASRLEHD